MRSAKRSIAPVALALATLAAIASPAQGGRRSDPIAVMACARTGCTETSTVTIPGPGDGTVGTDNLPAAATKATIKVSPPTNENVDPTFDELVATFVTDSPHLARLNKPAQRIITCIYLAAFKSSVYTNDSPTDFHFLSEPNASAFVITLQVCLQIALSLNHLHAVDVASPASAACFQAAKAIAVQFSHTRSGYVGRVSGATHKTSRRSPVALSCKRTRNRGLQLTVRPRARGRTLRQVVGPTLSLAYFNPSNKPVAVRTTFKVN